MSEIWFVGGRILDPATGFDAVGTVSMAEGVFRTVAQGDPAPPAGVRVVDCRGKWVVPGLIDLHVHLREPGEEYKETIATGAKAAVAGGFTAMVAMPNTKPPIDNGALVRFVADKGKEAGLARVYPSGAISKGLRGEELAEFGHMQEAGAVCVTDDGRPVMNAGLMRRALEYAKGFGLPVMVHEEDLHLSRGAVMNEGPTSARLGLPGFPNAGEDVMVLRDIELAALTGGHVHIAHLSTAGAVRAVRDAKRRGLHVTAEAAPHHFLLTDEAVATYDTNAKMCPPLRSQADVDAVREGLADGTLDAIATDHAPHSPLEKDVEFEKAANGIVGLETAVPLTLALVREGLLFPLRAIELLSWGPARIFRLPGGRIEAGHPADLTVIDPDVEWEIDAARFESKGRNTPFHGWKVQGRAVQTVVGGRIVYEAGR